MNNKAHSFGRVLRQLLEKNKLELVILGIYYTAILIGGEFARSVIISSIELGPHNVGSDVELYHRKIFLLNYVIPLSQVSLAFIPLINAIRYIHRKYARQKLG